MYFHRYGFVLLFFISLFANAQNTIPEVKIVDSQIEAQLSELISEENIKPYLAYFKKTETVRWQLSAPKDITNTVAYGLIVYLSPTDQGNMYEMWRPLLLEKQLVWIAADKAGNDYSAQRRTLQALLAVQLAAQKYSIDKRRIYIAGFSGGGRVASMMAPLYPGIFTGGIFMGGANFWSKNTPVNISLMQKNHYVFVNGEDDFNLSDSKSVFSKFKKAGIDNIRFFEVPKLGHMPADETWLGSAIDYLDGKSEGK